MLGSSRMYKTPVKPEPICVAKRILCASPPDKLPAFLDRVRYSSPTSIKNCNLWSISFKINSDIIVCVLFNSRLFKYSFIWRIDISVNSLMFFSPTLIDNISGFNLAPWQDGQWEFVIYIS